MAFTKCLIMMMGMVFYLEMAEGHELSLHRNSGCSEGKFCKTTGMVLQETPIKNATAASAIHCVSMCVRHQDCVSVNYNSTDKTCSLINVLHTASRNLAQTNATTDLHLSPAVCGAQWNLKTCIPETINGEWTAWSSWSSCSQSCMGGNRTRTRTCSNPEPQHGGTDCVGNNTETAECAVVACCSMSLYHTGRRITSGTQLLYAITSTKEECVNLCCADNECKYANWRNDGENACKTFSDWSGYTQGQSVPFDYFY